MQSMIQTLFNQALQMHAYLNGGVPKKPWRDDKGEFAEYSFVLDDEQILFRLPSSGRPEVTCLIVGPDEPRTLDDGEAFIKVKAVFDDLFAKTRADVERRHQLAAASRAVT